MAYSKLKIWTFGMRQAGGCAGLSIRQHQEDGIAYGAHTKSVCGADAGRRGFWGVPFGATSAG
jgi:hypothetical protein